MTTDGAANERLAASSIVKEGNELHCAAHNIQLVIDDQLNRKKDNTPALCARHREVVRKAHDLVVFINNHRDVHSTFCALARNKRGNVEGAKMYESLVLDVETRWDSELALLERLVYFDEEILTLFRDPQLQFPADMVLDEFGFDLAYAMTLVLNPFRVFTKFVQKKDVITLAYLPHYIDDLVSLLAPGSFRARLAGCADGVLQDMENFQSCLISSIRTRFGGIFEGESLALEAMYLLPGSDIFTFYNFQISEEVKKTVVANMMDDLNELLPPDTEPEARDLNRNMAAYALQMARRALDKVDDTVDPLEWWPCHTNLSCLFPLAKMLFGIPASSAENERSFSSASFTLDPRRTRLDIENFRKEHRIRRFLCAGADSSSQAGRELRLQRAETLMERYSLAVAAEKENTHEK